MMSQNLTLHDKLATVLVKFSCDASQPSRKYPSRAPPPPLSLLFFGILRILANLVSQH